MRGSEPQNRRPYKKAYNMSVSTVLDQWLTSGMENLLKEAFGYAEIKKSGRLSGGCINQGNTYVTECGKIFVKFNAKPGARMMFDGEFEGLKALAMANVKCPTPLKVLDNPNGGALLVMEYVDMNTLDKCSRRLGEKIAELHLHNSLLNRKKSNDDAAPDEINSQYVKQFGFHVPTCCGFIPQDNTWNDDWITFFVRQRLAHQINLIEKKYSDRETAELWSQLQLKIPIFFKEIENIQPSLLHGDLWGGNVAECDEEPVVFDPASFYGHHEYDLAIAGMFGGFSKSFFYAYHKKIPKAAGFDVRHELYQLFHYLNHWNHFGTSYKGSSISLMKKLLTY